MGQDHCEPRVYQLERLRYGLAVFREEFQNTELSDIDPQFIRKLIPCKNFIFT